MKTVLRYCWHFLVVLLVLALPAAGIALWQGAAFYYGESEGAYQAADEGPHIFQEGEHWVLKTLRGNREDGFWIDQQRHPVNAPFRFEVVFPLDGSRFSVQAQSEFVVPATRYQDDQPVFAVSDIEGNFQAFRNLLINARIIDAELNWRFARGHLVLVGDFIDRGPSSTQVLWLIYKLEQSARAHGGQVHYILGNHEIKNLQGDFAAAHEKYSHIAAMLGIPHHDLFADHAFLGRWLMSKNTAELINGVLFVHGGLHPELARRSYSLDQLNGIVRSSYRQPWYPRRDPGDDELLLNPSTGPSWYRGYFKDGLSQDEVEQTLGAFQANAVVVGHTLQSEVASLYGGKVFAIDVKHPWDYRQGFPPRRSEGLWLEAARAWRVSADGRRAML